MFEEGPPINIPDEELDFYDAPNPEAEPFVDSLPSIQQEIEADMEKIEAAELALQEKLGSLREEEAHHHQFRAVLDSEGNLTEVRNMTKNEAVHMLNEKGEKQEISENPVEAEKMRQKLETIWKAGFDTGVDQGNHNRGFITAVTGERGLPDGGKIIQWESRSYEVIEKKIDIVDEEDLLSPSENVILQPDIQTTQETPEQLLKKSFAFAETAKQTEAPQANVAETIPNDTYSFVEQTIIDVFQAETLSKPLSLSVDSSESVFVVSETESIVNTNEGEVFTLEVPSRVEASEQPAIIADSHFQTTEFTTRPPMGEKLIIQERPLAKELNTLIEGGLDQSKPSVEFELKNATTQLTEKPHGTETLFSHTQEAPLTFFEQTQPLEVSAEHIIVVESGGATPSLISVEIVTPPGEMKIEALPNAPEQPSEVVHKEVTFTETSLVETVQEVPRETIGITEKTETTIESAPVSIENVSQTIENQASLEEIVREVAPEAAPAITVFEVAHLPVVEAPTVIEVLPIRTEQTIEISPEHIPLAEFLADQPDIIKQLRTLVIATGERAELVLPGEVTLRGEMLDATVVTVNNAGEIRYEFRAAPDLPSQLSESAARRAFEIYDGIVVAEKTDRSTPHTTEIIIGAPTTVPETIKNSRFTSGIMIEQPRRVEATRLDGSRASVEGESAAQWPRIFSSDASDDTPDTKLPTPAAAARRAAA